jgi:hypothetical protein
MLVRIIATLEYLPGSSLLKIRLIGGTTNDSRVHRIESDDAGAVKRLAIEELQSLLDKFGPPPLIVKVKRDTAGLLSAISYRCANAKCRAKLFESWGPVGGIRIVCRKCKTLGIPHRADG